MATPIGETADYFTQRNDTFPQNSSSPEVHLYGGRNGSDSELDENQRNPSMPTRLSSGRRLPQISSQSFDPRNQWHRVMEKLTLGDGGATTRHSSSFLDTVNSSRFSHPNRYTQRYSSMDGSIYDDNNAYEMTSAGGEDTYRHPEDDALPTLADLEKNRYAPSQPESESSYFTHPFRRRPDDTFLTTATEEKEDQTNRQERLPRRHSELSPSQQAHTSGSNPPARKNWTKAIDKLRLISNIQHLHTKPALESSKELNQIAPFFQPGFQAPFIALSRDEDGRKLPPIFLPLIQVNITDSEHVNYYGYNQHLFRVELQYGDIKWVIRKTIRDFVGLHFNLKWKSSLSDLPNFPNQIQNLVHAARTTMGMDEEERENEIKAALERRKALTKYLRELLDHSHVTVSYDICEFLELSSISIFPDMGWKGKEAYLRNRVNFVDTRVCHRFRRHTWTKEWVLIRDSYIAFCESISSTTPTDVVVFDKSLYAFIRDPGIFSGYHGHLSIENAFRRFNIKGSKRQIGELMESLKRVQQDSPWVKSHRFNSFAPVRSHAKVKWFIDGEDHFNAVAEAILAARSEIFISDWWLSPELYLRRPPAENEDFRIDRLLKRKAEEGVMIYITIYKEVEAALTINSAHTKQWLQSLHPNIVVQRHPDHRNIDNVVLFWSHHEKIVVVDSRLAFIGGLDLCYGRWDTHQHQLDDIPGPERPYTMFPGQDYSNPRVKDFANVAQYDMTLVNREIIPRMPWHDVTIGVVGPIARDIARHFIQRWNFLKASKGMHRPRMPFLMPKGEYVAARDESKFKGSCRVQLLRSSAEWSSGVEREHSIYNAYVECISQAKSFIYIENQFFISTTGDDKILRNRIAQAIVERIKRAHTEKQKFKIFIVIPLIPAFEGDLASSEAYSARSVMHFEYVSISRGGNSIIEKLNEAGINAYDYIGWYSLRTYSKITPERLRTNHIKKGASGSKMDSGVDFQHEHHSRSSPNSTNGSPSPANSASFAIEDEEREQFVSELIYIHDKIMIVDDRIVIVGSANINDRSMLGNRDSEVAMLIEDTEKVTAYMDGTEVKVSKFAHTLRMQLWKEHLGLLEFTDWSSLMVPETGLRRTRRSLADSTLRLRPPTFISRVSEEIIRDIESHQPDQVLDGVRLSDQQALEMDEALQAAAALDPLSDHCYYNIWRKTAESNTAIYRQLFRCVPDDTVHTFEQHRQFLASGVPHGHIADSKLSNHEIALSLSNIQGHLVAFPTEYLKSENMLGSAVREAVVPMVIFT
ncbi:hypothetical protein BX666DRAFT_1977704 [Dichotomocladium elegans]|nr:hypothetical protein BX666DRAFT_1977704 [Dichotomocladium elegans]